jgi:PhzF family phenazine biosynthesis protein
VVLDADDLSAVQMQRIANEIHASETAFLSRGNDLHRPTRIRWFTPTTEVGFCGHATLAAAHTLHAAGRVDKLLTRPDASLMLDSAAGMLRLQPELEPAPNEAPLWWLAMPDAGLKVDHTDPVRTCVLLGLTVDDRDAALPVMRTRDDDIIYMVRNWQRLMDMQPDFAALARWCEQHHIRGVCVATMATPAKGVDVHSRFFAPACGVNEDPVTGSVHGPLATYLVEHKLVGSASGRSALICAQGRPGQRSGVVRVLVESTPRGYGVRIAGQCYTTLMGELCVPPA